MPVPIAASHILSGAAAYGAAAIARAVYPLFSGARRPTIGVVSRGRTARAGVALTFDDGPGAHGTPRVLDMLRDHAISGAFFVIGANAARYPSLVARMHAEGHLVCNHTYDHRAVAPLRSRAYWLDQLARTDSVIERITGRRPAYFRPPWGRLPPLLGAALRTTGHTTIGWTARALDGLPTTSDRIVERLSSSSPGDILVLHDGCEPWAHRNPTPTINALPRLISALRARSLEFTRLDALVPDPPYSTPESDPAPASV